MAGLLDNMNQALSSPMMGMGIGLLSGAAPGGTFAGGMQQGLLNAQSMAVAQGIAQERQQKAKMQQMQMQQMQQEQEAKQAYLSTLPQGQQALGGFAPEALAQQQAASMYPKPTKPSAQMEYLNMTPEQRAIVDAGKRAGAPQMNQYAGGPGVARILTPEEVNAIGGDEGDIAQENAKGEISFISRGDKERDAFTVLDTVQAAVDSYKMRLAKYGPKVVPSADRLELQSSYNNLMLEAKELYKLGVLSGDDAKILEAIMMDPTSAKAQLYSGEQLAQQLSVFEEKMSAARAKANQRFGITPKAESQQVKPTKRWNRNTNKLEDI